MSTALRTAQEALHQRAAAVVASRALLDATLGAGLDMDADQKAKLVAMEADIVRLTDVAATLQRQESREAELRARSEEPIRPMQGVTRTHEIQHGQPGEVPQWLKQVRSFYQAATPGAQLRMSEARALQADSATGGGYLIQKEHLSDLIRELDNVCYIRAKARKIRLTVGDSVDMPRLDAKPTAFAWGTELSAAPTDSAMKFGVRTLKTNPARGLIKVTRKMLRLADPPADRTVIEEFGALFGQQEENAFFNGTGAGQPMGLMVESDFGIPAARNYSTGNTTTLVKFDGLIGATYHIKKQYRKGAEWHFPRNVISQIRKEKDGQGQYLWNNAVALGQPDTILNYPVSETEYITATPATAELVGLFGNLDQYMIADGTDLEVQVLNEVFYATDEVGFKFAIELDGQVRDSNAFARVKLG